VRRAVGVAIHFWAKRTKGAEGQLDNAKILFTFIKPMLDEKEYQAAKGVGWGLKTLGRYYPNIAFEWLTETLIIEKRRPIAIIRKKALTYLPSEMKQSFSRQS
jgi:3-methyladenine DNA glycosylase AlkD